MGTSSAQINNQISTTRDQIDANLDVLEKRASDGMRRTAIIAGASAAAALVVGGVSYAVYRRMHKPTFRERVRHAMPDSWMDLQKDVRKRLGSGPVKVVITSADGEEIGSLWESTARQVAPALITSALSALLAGAARRRRGHLEPDTIGE